MSASPIFAALAARDPESLIFHGSRSSWCARDVLDAVSRSAARLEGTHVLAILADNSPDWVLADLAARSDAAGIIATAPAAGTKESPIVAAAKKSAAASR